MSIPDKTTTLAELLAYERDNPQSPLTLAQVFSAFNLSVSEVTNGTMRWANLQHLAQRAGSAQAAADAGLIFNIPTPNGGTRALVANYLSYSTGKVDDFTITVRLVDAEVTFSDLQGVDIPTLTITPVSLIEETSKSSIEIQPDAELVLLRNLYKNTKQWMLFDGIDFDKMREFAIDMDKDVEELNRLYSDICGGVKMSTMCVEEEPQKTHNVDHYPV